MDRIVRIARKIVADTTLSKYRESELALQRLKDEKKKWEDKIEGARKIIEQFKKDIESGVFSIGGNDKKTIEKNKKLYLKMCDHPKSSPMLGFDFEEKHADYPLVDKIDPAFSVFKYYLKEPEKLQRKIDDYENKLKFMKKDLEGAIKLRDHLPPEFEKALQNVYDKILQDCRSDKKIEVNKCQNRINNVWDIFANPNNPQYKYWAMHFGRNLPNYLNVDVKDCASENDYKNKVTAAAQSYIDDLQKLQGNAQGLIEYIESHPIVLNCVKSNFDYRNDKCAGDAQMVIRAIEHRKEWQIEAVCGAQSGSPVGLINKYRDYFKWMLDNALKINPEAQAMGLYNDMKNRFVDDLSRYCSEIVSVQNASIGIKGNIDAIVVAPNGKFKVQAVPAGGYNIQRYHYRVLINRLKE